MLEGDPYAALLALEEWPNQRLRGLIDAAFRDEDPRPWVVRTFVGERLAHM